MDCGLIGDRLEAFHDDLLEGSERKTVERHLAGCDLCRGELERVREIEKVLWSAGAAERPAAPKPPTRSRGWKERLPMGIAATMVLGMLTFFMGPAAWNDGDLIRSAKSGAWSSAETWEGGVVPGEGARVQVRAGHRVEFDVRTEKPIRFLHVAGTLAFARDRDTRLDVGVLRIQPGEEIEEDGFACAFHPGGPNAATAARPALLMGTPNEPIPAEHTAVIRLHYIEGMNKDTAPAIACCSGRMEFHGAPLSRTWVKLGATAKAGDSQVVLAEPVTGWRPGDRVIVTATQRRYEGRTRRLSTEERTIKAMEDDRIVLDRPLEHEHLGEGEYRGEVAVLSRNVVVESADPAGIRGHTVYHRFSKGSISYAEFRHLGKENHLGRYSIHFHLVGDTMRGASVVGASIWDSGNRWITIHGTQYLVVRDCVGYKSVGHGFFLEDGSEQWNILDRNLAVQASKGKRLPKQIFGFDQNNGAGFWWANSLNAFTRNVAVECGQYGFRYEATFRRSGKGELNVSCPQPDGSEKVEDIRTKPFVRFEGNEVHSTVGLYGINLGQGVDRVGPDRKHPFVLRDTKIWNVHYAFRPQAPNMIVENMKIWRAAYGVYHPNYDHHVFRNLYIGRTNAEPFNRGHDDRNRQYGPLTVDGLTLEECSGTLIQMSEYAPEGNAVCHFRDVKFVNDHRYRSRRVNTTENGQPKSPPPNDLIPYYFHDHYGPGRDAMVVTVSMLDKLDDREGFREEKPFTGTESRVKEVADVEFPNLLVPVDDQPPATVITSVRGNVVRGSTTDDGRVARVVVNGREARALAPNFSRWEIELDGPPVKVEAHSVDAAGNVEARPHRRTAK